MTLATTLSFTIVAGLVSELAFTKYISPNNRSIVDTPKQKSAIMTYFRRAMSASPATSIHWMQDEEKVDHLISKTVQQFNTCSLFKSCSIDYADAVKNEEIRAAVRKSLAKVNNYGETTYYSFLVHYMSIFLSADFKECQFTRNNWNGPK
ncbi:hypothetical protein BDF22DRAFT_692979 [Syncephalis plumigaleata]|nr:hypothetical protein BDF22DRAFT_692979 [Syncephalis plumigaleata]